MTFKEISSRYNQNYAKYSEVPEELKILFKESLKLIDDADKKIFAAVYKEEAIKFQTELKKMDNAKFIANSNGSSGDYDPESTIMNALRNGEGDKYGF